MYTVIFITTLEGISAAEGEVVQSGVVTLSDSHIGNLIPDENIINMWSECNTSCLIQ